MDDKPFHCPSADCNMAFVNEDHLTVHKKKHELSLTLTPTTATFKNPFVDQTPTPTRFLNALESDLFQDFQNDNPFDATFRKANSSNGGANLVLPESSSLIASLPDSEVLNTPSITLPSEPETPIALKSSFINKVSQKEQNNQTYSENTDTLPFTPVEQHTQDTVPEQSNVSNDVSSDNASFSELAAPSLSAFSETSHKNDQRNNATRTSVVQTRVITSVGSILKSNTTGVPTAVVTRSAPNGISSVTSSQVVTEKPSQTKIQEQQQPVVQSVCVTPMVQLMIRLPDGQTMPVQFPVMTSGPATQPAQTVPPIVPQASQQVSSSSSVTKMKLKEAITMNQKSGGAGKKNNTNGRVRSKQSIQLLPVQDSSLDGFGLSLSPPPSPITVQRPGHNGRKRRDLSDDPDEKRRRSLERNRAAATRCREKRKQWITALEKKANELANTNTQLQHEVTQLRNEVAHLKTMLLAHKDCPVTLQQKASNYDADREVFTTVRIITSASDDVQQVPNSTVVSPLNAEFMEMDVNSVQSSNDGSFTSDTSDTSFRER
ncbi:cyclic AMP-dependent transcription factor ATF-7-like [Stegodyphus dumicola]|uniref:cyclic AMP-dependent transcription factor ATF-7-like n=1 Tax=Stegodyphus dumicola TaxID=202533 RepID=UPI0015AE6FB8|nr:cyclic AMP-dependent transcription factor ATF-7-like [Stegodyphus dumicola]